MLFSAGAGAMLFVCCSRGALEAEVSRASLPPLRYAKLLTKSSPHRGRGRAVACLKIPSSGQLRQYVK